MRRRMRRITALLAGAVFATGLLALSSSVSAATQAELEEKVRILEKALGEVKQELQEMKEAQKKETAEKTVKVAQKALPAWVQRIDLYGDLRFRHQFVTYSDLNGKSRDDRNRFLVRLRFGAKSQIHSDVKIGFRMSSGADDNPTSTNETLGNFFAEKDKWGIDRAYVIWTPSFVPDRMLDLSFGKVQNPFVTSKAIWDGDVVPEGAFLTATFNKKSNMRPFVTAGAMLVDESATDWPDDIYALAVQGGVNADFGPLNLLAAMTYTDWGHLGEEGNLPPNIFGNTLNPGGETLSGFKVWDIYARAGYDLSSKTTLDIWGHYLVNTDASGRYDDEDTGFALGAGLRYDKLKVSSWYKYVEANATPGFISDSDSGYVNRKGYILDFSYKVLKPLTLSLTYFDMKAVDETLPGASNDYKMILTQGVFKF